jgi:hypothetical protein
MNPKLKLVLTKGTDGKLRLNDAEVGGGRGRARWERGLLRGLGSKAAKQAPD